MKTIELTALVDKAAWARGPWDDEPDKVQWPDAATGLPCLAVRHSVLGQWCGYVGVPETHPLFRKDPDEPEVSVHGGLTFAGACAEEGPEPRICHTPDPGEPDNIWWFGFDCGHAWDRSPGLEAEMSEILGRDSVLRGMDLKYRTIEYVRDQCARLAGQLGEIAQEPNAK